MTRCPVEASIHSVAVWVNPPGEVALVLDTSAAKARSMAVMSRTMETVLVAESRVAAKPLHAFFWITIYRTRRIGSVPGFIYNVYWYA